MTWQEEAGNGFRDWQNDAKGKVYMQQLKFAGGHPPNYYAAD
jgi:hypothetical protein